MGFEEKFSLITREEIKKFEGRESYLNMFENEMYFGKKNGWERIVNLKFNRWLMFN